MEDSDLLHSLRKFMNIDYPKAKRQVAEVQEAFKDEIEKFSCLDYNMQDKIIECLMAIREE